MNFTGTEDSFGGCQVKCSVVYKKVGLHTSVLRKRIGWHVSKVETSLFRKSKIFFGWYFSINDRFYGVCVFPFVGYHSRKNKCCSVGFYSGLGYVIYTGKSIN